MNVGVRRNKCIVRKSPHKDGSTSVCVCAALSLLIYKEVRLDVLKTVF